MTEEDRRMLRETHEAVMSLTGEVKSLRSRLGDIIKTVYGNGQKGLQDLVTMLITKQEDCPARIATKASVRAANTGNLIAYSSLAVSLLMCLIVLLDKFI